MPGPETSQALASAAQPAMIVRSQEVATENASQRQNEDESHDALNEMLVRALAADPPPSSSAYSN